MIVSSMHAAPRASSGADVAGRTRGAMQLVVDCVEQLLGCEPLLGSALGKVVYREALVTLECVENGAPPVPAPLAEK